MTSTCSVLGQVRKMAGAPWRDRVGLALAPLVFEVALCVPGGSGVGSQKTDLEVREVGEGGDMGCKQPQAAGCVGSHGLALAWSHFYLSGCHRAVSKTSIFRLSSNNLCLTWEMLGTLPALG